jgi:hypothetical protein
MVVLISRPRLRVSGRASGHPFSTGWSNETISALMKPRWKSVWITPAACGAVAPIGSSTFSPAVPHPCS